MKWVDVRVLQVCSHIKLQVSLNIHPEFRVDRWSNCYGQKLLDGDTNVAQLIFDIKFQFDFLLY